MRGLHKSKPMEDLISEAEFPTSGTKELVLIAQDTTDYGKDIYGKKILQNFKLSKIKEIEWIRLMYAYPTKFADDLIEEIKTNPKFVNMLIFLYSIFLMMYANQCERSDESELNY
jgi:ribosomal protein S12 methylthiotransferase